MIYLLRHGQTEFNRERRMQGQQESRLTALGERQAGAMAALLSDLLRIDPPAPWRIVASPLGRAAATAAIVGARLGLPVELDRRLMEICVGDWEGRLRDDVLRSNPAFAQDEEWIFKAPGGESFERLSGRVASWLADQEGEERRRLIVVSHGVSGRLLRGAYAGLSRSATMAQDVPQDAIYRLRRGQVDRIDCAPVDGDDDPVRRAI